MFDSSDRLSDRSDEAFTRYDRRTDQSDRPVGPTIGTRKGPVTLLRFCTFHTRCFVNVQYAYISYLLLLFVFAANVNKHFFAFMGLITYGAMEVRLPNLYCTNISANCLSTFCRSF